VDSYLNLLLEGSRVAPWRARFAVSWLRALVKPKHARRVLLVYMVPIASQALARLCLRAVREGRYRCERGVLEGFA
jgi:hypothetical protein